MKEIPLTQGKTALVDDADYEWLSQWKWFACYDPTNGWSAARKIALVGHRRNMLMHREIMNAPDGIGVDHKDHDGLHNWRANLRLCTTQQNNRNQRLRKDNMSGYKGVNWHHGRWRSYIKVNGRQQFLGYYDTAEEAGRAYDAAATQAFGAFAYLNQAAVKCYNHIAHGKPCPVTCEEFDRCRGMMAEERRARGCTTV